MRAWSRGDRIAFWSLVVAVISCIAAIKSIPRPDPDPVRAVVPHVLEKGGASDPRAAQQMALQQEQALATHDEAIRLFEARMDLRRQRMQTRREERSAAGLPYNTVAIQNGCDQPIFVAVNYMELDDAWVTRGWWVVPPGQVGETDVVTANRWVYLYAENQQAGLVWSPQPGQFQQTKSVVAKAFTLPDGEPPVYPDTRTATFFGVDIGPTFQRYVHSFTCSE